MTLVSSTKRVVLDITSGVVPLSRRWPMSGCVCASRRPCSTSWRGTNSIGRGGLWFSCHGGAKCSERWSLFLATTRPWKATRGQLAGQPDAPEWGPGREVGRAVAVEVEHHGAVVSARTVPRNRSLRRTRSGVSSPFWPGRSSRAMRAAGGPRRGRSGRRVRDRALDADRGHGSAPRRPLVPSLTQSDHGSGTADDFTILVTLLNTTPPAPSAAGPG